MKVDETDRNIAEEFNSLPTQDANWLSHTVFGAPVDAKPEALACMTEAVLNWNLANIEYNPLGPNSNSFVGWILHECSVRAWPDVHARTIGWTYWTFLPW
jgi:hypothetical protein